MTPPRAAVAAISCGLTAAMALPGSPLGAGVFVVAGLIAAVVASARPTRPSPHTVVCAGLALALAAMAVVRDAGWLVGVDLLAAAALGSLAVAGGTTWSGVVRGGGAAGMALLKGLLFVIEPARAGGGRILRGRGPGLARGLLLGGAGLVVFGALFASADRAFLQLASWVLVPDIQASLLPARIYLLVVVAGLTGAYIVIGPRYAVATEDAGRAEVAPPQRSLGAVEWSIPLALLNLLFAGFVGVQMAVLFGGRHHVLDTVGLSYAQYARQGFFQLVSVAALVMLVIAAAIRWARAETGAQRILLRFLLGALCAFTIVILASALRRLTLYEELYGLTRLRVSVHAVILWLALLFTMMIVAGLLWRGTWLPRAFFYTTAGALLILSLVNPEGLIARQNVERFRATGSIDLSYLEGLSADAVPALSGLRADMRDCVFEEIGAGLDRAAGWASFNLARARATRVIEQFDDPVGSCSTSPPGRLRY